MSKMNLLKQIVDDLKKLSYKLDELYQAMEHPNEKEDIEIKQSIPKESDTYTVTITLEEVRAVLADKSRLGFTKDIKHLITEFGATKLSEVKPHDYATLLRKAEELGND